MSVRQQYVAMKWTDYTPQVESQITRDVIALTSLAAKRNADEEIVIVSDSDKADKVIDALGVRRVPLLHLARIWLVYKTGEEWPEVPETARHIIQRDMQVRVKRPNMRVNDNLQGDGYYLPPQGRPRPDKIQMIRPAPNGYSPVDPALIILWS